MLNDNSAVRVGNPLRKDCVIEVKWGNRFFGCFFYIPSTLFLFHDFDFSHLHCKLCFHVLFLAHYKMWQGIA